MATMLAVEQINRVRYAGMDFATHFDELRAELQTKFAADFNDFAVSSMAIMLLDITAYGLDTLSFYLDRRATDAYLGTAQTRKAVARLARQVGYKMKGAVSASTDVLVAIKKPVNFEVTIPSGFQFRGPNDLIFECAEETVFPKQSSVGKLIPVYEGQTITETFAGTGAPNQVFQLQRIPSGKSLVQNSVTVFVNGTTFVEADFLPISGGQYFEIGYNDAPPTVRFGDGLVSASDIPVSGATISVTYIAAQGLKGQVAANTIKSVVNSLVVQTQVINLSITNPEAAVGGADSESINSAKTNAGKVYRTRDVAVTKSDYLALAGTYSTPLYGRVAVAQAYSSRSSATDLELQQLLQDIRDAIASIYPNSIAQTSAIETDADTIDTQVLAISAATGLSATAIPAKLAQIATSTSTINTKADTCLTSVSSLNAQLTAGVQLLADSTKIGVAAPITKPITVAYTQPTSPVETLQITVDSVTAIVIGSKVKIYKDSDGSIVGTYTVTTVPTATEILLTVVSRGTGYPGGTPLAASETYISYDQTSVLSNATKNALLEYYSTASTLTTDINLAVGGIKTEATTVDTASAGIQILNTAISASNTTISAASTAIHGAVVTLNTILAPLNPTGAVTETVYSDLDKIDAHVNELLASECSANLVVVPILMQDSDGFYVAPSFGLTQSLQAYLNARKSVTQTVQVASGTFSLVYVTIAVRVGVLPGFSEGNVVLAVQAVLDGLLKARQFGVSLYRSEIVNTVLAVAGVDYVDPSIVSPASYLDSYGNLIIPEDKIITKGTVTITTVIQYA